MPEWVKYQGNSKVYIFMFMCIDVLVQDCGTRISIVNAMEIP